MAQSEFQTCNVATVITSKSDSALPEIITPRKFCVAPMLDWTDRHCRYFYRLMSKHAYLYTEMITTGALLHGDRDRFLQYHPDENPLACQLGGSHPLELAACAKMVEDYGYHEVNLNVGCPSDRVQNGRFGACLMATPELVAECLSAMSRVVSIPVTVKCRIGIDDQDSYEALHRFITLVSEAGCRVFIIHARKAWLSGLSPKENREIPPLRYDVVYRIKRDFPQLEIILNGGVRSLDQALVINNEVDGVMVGREVYQNPYLLAGVDELFYRNFHAIKSREQIVEALLPYVGEQLKQGVRLYSIARHLLGLFHGVPGARSWRRHISENGTKQDADQNTLLKALDLISR
ncbi:tRNA dihydrouridine(20/20a) synthase DusA [Methylotuvimicrobium buryatense]|uniref:tRNA-dihydrouridine(20/20a) synthase n=1 Tax=Methylotuvimicrobium buryatense TaxID=95641 RepID=A0A4P9UMS8_METBY|nr:tRNA dihydrouridine(20/20a) synthase DusA [Methylotuvimicrobium buryatense]QCW82604.1 tRNA dihydrouridine(20/20a) synthase DusA [Methylotuvimicrobium buryatense]